MVEECACPKCNECVYKEECFIPEYRRTTSKRRNKNRLIYEEMEYGYENICDE